MKTIIEMALEAGLIDFRDSLSAEYTKAVLEDLTEFAELVRADERQQIIAKNAPEIERINAYIKTLEESVATQARSNT